jgi:hypothetical protein
LKKTTRIAPLRSEEVLHVDPTEKANILNRQFQSAFSSEGTTEKVFFLNNLFFLFISFLI